MTKKVKRPIKTRRQPVPPNKVHKDKRKSEKFGLKEIIEGARKQVDAWPEWMKRRAE